MEASYIQSLHYNIIVTKYSFSNISSTDFLYCLLILTYNSVSDIVWAPTLGGPLRFATRKAHLTTL